MVNNEFHWATLPIANNERRVKISTAGCNIRPRENILYHKQNYASFFRDKLSCI